MSITVSVDLRPQFGPVRDQGDRPTCLAFAASDAHAGLRDPWEPLSCEYLFYHAQNRASRDPTQGAFLSDTLVALREDGQPREAGWPYLAMLPTDLSTYYPPAAVDPLFGRDGIQVKNTFDAICRQLDSGNAVLVLSVLTGAFFRPPADGIIHAIAGDAIFPVPRHALVAVGYGHIGQTRLILVRNSWGPTWGLAGYAWLTEPFVSQHAYDLALLTDEIDVSHRSAAV